MKPFFSIELVHEYDQGPASALTIVPAASNDTYLRHQRLWLKQGTGYLKAFIEDDESLKDEVDVLYFWVVCVEEDFYSYTEYPNDINFSVPQYFWHNEHDPLNLNHFMLDAESINNPPMGAIGLIGIYIKELPEDHRFSIRFNVRHTLWQYNIIPKASQRDWTYRVEDQYKVIDKNEADDAMPLGFDTYNKKWEFNLISHSENEQLVFQINAPMPFMKRSDGRFVLEVTPPEGQQHLEKFEMVLPYATYAYKMVDENNIELTPIYIYI